MLSSFQLGDIKLQQGFTLPNAHVAYKTYGTLNAAKDNVIVYPTWFTGFETNNEWLIGKVSLNKLDKYKYKFIMSFYIFLMALYLYYIYFARHAYFLYIVFCTIILLFLLMFYNHTTNLLL